MKTVLFALNGSYTHTNLAVRCIRNTLRAAGSVDCAILERSLRDPYSECLYALFAQKAAIYGFSCYIWNIDLMCRLAADLKTLFPSSLIVFGGPEASFDCGRFSGVADCVICGEGETAFAALCEAYMKGENLAGRIISGSPDPDFVRRGIEYLPGEDLKNRIVYYESSRGCPFSCSYCLSSAGHGMRAKTAEKALSDLREFDKFDGIDIVKLVDRTFNADVGRANRIWRGISGNGYGKKYHFEIAATLLDEESFAVFADMPPGRIQLEAGLQSVNPDTLMAVARHIDVEKTLENCRRIRKIGNIHIHLDLIAGLPYDDYAGIGRAFDAAYDVCDRLQLGFLKLLHGTRLREEADKFGCRYMKSAPYEVLATDTVSFDELRRLEGISSLLERYRDGGRFEKTLSLVLNGRGPFKFYEGLCDHINKSDGRDITKISQPDAYKLIYEYALTLSGVNREELLHAMRVDFGMAETRRLPEFLRGDE